MILVTVGTHDKQFDRLVKAADELAGLIDEQVIIQIGKSNFEPKHATYYDFVTMEEMDELMKQARVVVAQAGAGTIISVFHKNKPLILVPRLKKFGEHFNDHQIELANILFEQKRAILIENPTGEALFHAVNKTPLSYTPSGEVKKLITAISNQLQIWSG